jgi:hypothetical protein
MNSSSLSESSAQEHQLRQKLAAVLAAPPQSSQKAKAMSDLLRIVMQLPGIERVAHQDYLLALNQTWEWMSRNIDDFQPSTTSLSKDLVTWVNGYLYWRIRDIYTRKPDKKSPISLDETIFENGETYLDLLSDSGFGSLDLSSLDGHIRSIQQQENRTIATAIENWIESDPDRELQGCYLRDRQHCHCQEIGYRLVVKDPPDSLTEIAKDLNIPYQTLVAHWKRRCLPILQSRARQLGYEPEG